MRAHGAAPSRLVVICQAAAAATAGVLALGGVVAISPEGLAAFPITDLWKHDAGPTTTAQAALPDLPDLVTGDPERLFPVPTVPAPADPPRDKSEDDEPTTEPTPGDEPTTSDTVTTPQVPATTAPDSSTPDSPEEEPPAPAVPAPTSTPTPTREPEPQPTTKPTPKPTPPAKPTPTPSTKPSSTPQPTTKPTTKPTPKPTPTPSPSCTPTNPGNGRSSTSSGQGLGGPGRTGESGVGVRCNGVGPQK
jgi:hypothetical protein